MDGLCQVLVHLNGDHEERSKILIKRWWVEIGFVHAQTSVAMLWG